MSDQPSGPGWWLASDGKWYPPDQAPPVPPPETWLAPPPGPPPRAGMSSGAITALVVACVLGVLLLVGAGAMLLGTDSESGTDAASPSAPEGEAEDGSTVEEIPAPTVPEGFEVAEGEGVSIAVPTAWTVLDPEDVSMTPDELEKAFPDASPEVVQQEAAMFVKGAVLVAFDLTDDAFASNVNILRFPIDQGLDELGEQGEYEIEALGGEVRSNDEVQLPVGPAARVAYEADVTLPDGSTRPARGVQHYVPIDGYTYVITVTGAGDVDALSDQMVATFRAS